MNNKTMMIGSFAVVAMLLAVGIGYAAYTGSITSNENKVESQFVTVGTDGTKANITLPKTNIVYNTSWDGALYNTDVRDNTYEVANFSSENGTPVAATLATAQIFGVTTLTITSTETVAEEFTVSMMIDDYGSLSSKIKILAYVTDDSHSIDLVGSNMTGNTITAFALDTWTTLKAADNTAITMNKAAGQNSKTAYVVFAAYIDNGKTGDNPVTTNVTDSELQTENKALNANNIVVALSVSSDIKNQSNVPA